MANLLEQLMSLAAAGTVMISSALTAAAPQNDINGLLFLQNRQWRVSSAYLPEVREAQIKGKVREMRDDAATALEQMAADLLNGRREKKDSVRDEILHTVACKAAIKAGWQSSEKELLVLVEQVMKRDDLKHCPHGRPICITLSKKQLEKQFKRS